jgi:hypothetical protein
MFNNLKAFLEHKTDKFLPKYSDYQYLDGLLNWFKNKKDSKTLFLAESVGKIGFSIKMF